MTETRRDATPDAPAMARRSFLGCALAFGVTGPILVACGADDSSSGGGSDGSGSSGGGDSSTPTAAAGTALVAAADVPVGGGVALTDAKIVVTQPSKGEFKAFSAICTHQGATIDKVQAGDMVCPLHGSKFSIADGSVDNGPATKPLTEIAVAVKGGQVVRA